MNQEKLLQQAANLALELYNLNCRRKAVKNELLKLEGALNACSQNDTPHTRNSTESST